MIIQKLSKFGTLVISPETELEYFALMKWHEIDMEKTASIFITNIKEKNE